MNPPYLAIQTKILSRVLPFVDSSAFLGMANHLSPYTDGSSYLLHLIWDLIRGGLCNHSTGRHLPGPGWNLRLWVWKVFLMGLCILLLEPHVSGSRKSPVQTLGMAAKQAPARLKWG